MSVMMMTPAEMAMLIARQAREKRLSLNLSQVTLCERSGVSYGVIKRFECSGQISLQSLLKLAITLDALAGFKDLFPKIQVETAASLEALMQDHRRKRGRR